RAAGGHAREHPRERLPGSGRPALPADGNHPEREPHPRGGPADLRRREPPLAAVAGVSAPRRGGKIEGGRADDEGGRSGPARAGEPPAVEAPGLALRDAAAGRASAPRGLNAGGGARPPMASAE